MSLMSHRGSLWRRLTQDTVTSAATHSSLECLGRSRRIKQLAAATISFQATLKTQQMAAESANLPLPETADSTQLSRGKRQSTALPD